MALSTRANILRGVFASALLDSSTPTPQATPLIGQGSFGETQHSDARALAVDEDSTTERIRWERSWHTATSFLLSQINAGSTRPRSNPCPPDVQQAIRYVRAPDSVGYRLRKSSQADDLLWWYSQAIQLSFLQKRSSLLVRLCANIDQSEASWKKACAAMQDSFTALLGPYYNFIVPFASLQSAPETAAIESGFASLLAASVAPDLRERLLQMITHTANAILQDHDSEDPLPEESMEGIENTQPTHHEQLLLSTLSDLSKSGLSPVWLETVLAEGLTRLIPVYVAETYARRWESPSSCVDELKSWISGPFLDLVRKALHSLSESHSIPFWRGPHSVASSAAKVDAAQILDLQQHAITELGRLRLSELFDIVVEWDHGSKGGIEDLRHYANSPARRKYVIQTFTGVLSYRLLIPGASTTEILQMYIRIIRAFALLDSRFVVLDRVGRPIRRYLRDRDDTVKIIVSGLLADPDDPDPPADALIELATELHEMDEIASGDEDLELDWDDMTWMPNPADAEPDFKKSKNQDVIGNLVSLFDNQEIFVREFQNILGERLLGAGADFDREIRVLELLKSRFGDAALQGCEVMLKDIFDSRRTDLHIKKEQKIEAVSNQPELNAKILSRHFWPSLRSEEFKVPPQVQALQERYSFGFEEHKTQRKLAWLPALGQVTVELQLKYRTVRELVTTWQASVIYAFSSEDDDDEPVRRTADQVVEELEMDDDLVANALVFWVSKMVLFESQPGIFEVLEVLPSEEDAKSVAGEQKASANILAAAQSASAAAAASAASAVRSEEELADERMEVVWQFVVAMLTNQGAQPLQQIVMVLSVMLPGGFTHSNEEFRAFLQRRVDDGSLEMAGANYKIPKKS